MRQKAITIRLLAIALSLTVVAGLVAGFHRLPTTLALQSSVEAQAPGPVASEVLVHATPLPVDNPELALGRVTIMPGGSIPSHHHPGTQIAVIVQGDLTYSVSSGVVELKRADNPAGSPTLIHPRETVVVHTGDALIETPGAIHQSRNDGDIPVVIYLSTLFPAGVPRAIPDAAATPHP